MSNEYNITIMSHDNVNFILISICRSGCGTTYKSINKLENILITFVRKGVLFIFYVLINLIIVETVDVLIDSQLVSNY